MWKLLKTEPGKSLHKKNCRFKRKAHSLSSDFLQPGLTSWAGTVICRTEAISKIAEIALNCMGEWPYFHNFSVPEDFKKSPGQLKHFYRPMN